MAVDRETLRRGVRLRGLVAAGDITVIAVEPHGDSIVNVVYRTDDGQIGDRGHDGMKWVGLQTAVHVSARPSGLVVHPTHATAQLDEAIPPPPPPSKAEFSKYYARFDLSGARSIKHLEDILRELVDHLAKAEGATVGLTLEVNASSTGFSEHTVRTVKENAGNLGAKSNEFEQ